MASLNGKTAVVTGAGRGIGEAIARRFVEAGARVAVLSRTEQNSAAVAASINETHPGAATPFAVDVADPEACMETGRKVIEALGGGVDILVNNAGVTRDGLLLRMKDEDWETVLRTNLSGAFHMLKAVQRPLLKSPAGRIINISSVIGLMGNAGQANYAASKAGLIGFTKSVAREFASRGVTANCIAPGFIVTDMTGALTDELQEKIRSGIPLGRFGSVDEIAAAALFLAGPDAGFITGQVLTVDGGMVM